MANLNPHKRRVLRLIQDHFNTTRLRHGTRLEQASTVDIYYHPQETAATYNYVTPRRGAAWVPGTDVATGLNRLAELDRIPRLELVKGLFPSAFHNQLRSLGLSVETDYPLMTYGLIPNCEQEEMDDQFALPYSTQVAVYEAANQQAVATWLCLGLEGRTPASEQVEQLWQNVVNGKEMYFLASHDVTLAGGAGVILNPPAAEILCVDTIAPYRRHGIASTALRAAVAYAQGYDCSLIFLIAASDAAARLYRRLGFVDLDHVVTYCKPAGVKENESAATYVRDVAQPVSTHR
ncbi:MAG: GNAT family N-acetyltransferase [Anaerolineae bacterium]|nr:GNAT family N-acetyltransferase [Anaerolineae bacterium]